MNDTPLFTEGIVRIEHIALTPYLRARNILIGSFLHYKKYHRNLFYTCLCDCFLAILYMLENHPAESGKRSFECILKTKGRIVWYVSPRMLKDRDGNTYFSPEPSGICPAFRKY